jgi:multimeric flavodoxin WrbA
VKNVIFRECRETPEQSETGAAGKTTAGEQGKVILLNGSMRNVNGNSAKLARTLASGLKADTEIVDLKQYMNDLDGLISILDESKTIVLCVPLYVDGLPSRVIKLMERMEQNHTGPKHIYLLANMGLYESEQLNNLFGAVKQWCAKAGFVYCGGLGISAGELMGTLMEAIPFNKGTTKKASQGMDRLASAIDNSEITEDIYAEPFAFPRWLYVWIANTNWNRTSRKNGIKPKDMFTKDI